MGRLGSVMAWPSNAIIQVHKGKLLRIQPKDRKTQGSIRFGGISQNLLGKIAA